MKNNNEEDRVDFLIWLRFAQEDFLSAKILLNEGIYNQVCYHSQQAAEKMLKAFLKFQGVVPPKIHSLLELLDMCKEKNIVFSSLQKDCEYLSRFYLPVRYPDALPGSLPDGLPNSNEAGKAIDCAEAIMIFIKKILQKEN